MIELLLLGKRNFNSSGVFIGKPLKELVFKGGNLKIAIKICKDVRYHYGIQIYAYRWGFGYSPKKSESYKSYAEAMETAFTEVKTVIAKNDGFDRETLLEFHKFMETSRNG